MHRFLVSQRAAAAGAMGAWYFGGMGQREDAALRGPGFSDGAADAPGDGEHGPLRCVS